MTHRRALAGGLLALAIAAGCQPALPTGPRPPKASKAPVTPAEKSPSPTVSAPASNAPPLAPLTHYTGLVLNPDGSPAKDITVRGHIISSNGAGLTSKTKLYRLTQASAVPEVKTDEQGRFKLAHPDGQPLNLEAVKSPELKAIQFNVAATASDVKLQLAPTGTISGKVKSSNAQVTDFEGVDIFVPGTTYFAKATKDGSYAIPNLPVGSFSLVATKTGLGRAEATGVQVESKLTTTAPELVLTLPVPKVTALTQANGGPGVEVTITGENFGATSGKVFSITLGGAAVTNPERLNDTTLKIKVPVLAVTGDVIVTVDGIASVPTPFQVTKSLMITSPVRNLLAGTSRKVHIAALDTAGKPIENPVVRWTARGVKVAEDATVTAEAAGTGELAVESGEVIATDVVQVHEGSQVLTDVAGGARGFKDGYARQAQFNQPSGLTFDKAGNAYIADASNYRIRKVTPEGHVTTIAGNGVLDHKDGQGANASFWLTSGIVVDDAGNIYVTSNSSTLRKITPDGTVSTLAGEAGVRGNTDGVGSQARFYSPEGLTLGPDGALYVADYSGYAIRRVTLDGTVTTLKDAGGQDFYFYNISKVVFGPDGTMYVCANNKIEKVTPEGQRSLLAGGKAGSVDGKGAEAGFKRLFDIALGPDGNLYAPDDTDVTGATGWSMRVITPDGTVTTLPAVPYFYRNPEGEFVVENTHMAGQFLAFDPQGRLHFLHAPSGSYNPHLLFRIDKR